MILTIIFTAVAILYFLMILSFIFGFLKIKTFNQNIEINSVSDNLKLSVIIPVRNEENNLKSLILGLKKQDLDSNYFEIIFVNDNSTDISEAIILEEIQEKNNFKLLNLKNNEQGKKSAIAKGVEFSSGNYIVTTDADCIHEKSWLSVIYNFIKLHKPTMLIAPVEMTGNTFFQKLQILEFSSLIGSTVGSVGIKHPIMCNGANLIYEKKTYEKVKKSLTEKEISGDDIFLLHAIKKLQKNKILFLKSQETIVKTDAERNFKSFVKQRLRWSSKSKSYKDADTIFVALIVLLTNLFLPFIVVLTVLKIVNLSVMIIFLILKLIPDFLLLFLTVRFLGNKKLLFYCPAVNLFYYFYIIFIAISGLFYKKVSWKSRKT